MVFHRNGIRKNFLTNFASWQMFVMHRPDVSICGAPVGACVGTQSAGPAHSAIAQIHSIRHVTI